MKHIKTHCPRGHEYTEANIYRHTGGGRECKTCKRAVKPSLAEMVHKQLRVYRVSVVWYLAQTAFQGGVCALCKRLDACPAGKDKKPRRLSVDHCHMTGRIRGLLCTSCNVFLGKYERLDLAARNYLRQPQRRDDEI